MRRKRRKKEEHAMVYLESLIRKLFQTGKVGIYSSYNEEYDYYYETIYIARDERLSDDQIEKIFESDYPVDEFYQIIDDFYFEMEAQLEDDVAEEVANCLAELFEEDRYAEKAYLRLYPTDTDLVDMEHNIREFVCCDTCIYTVHYPYDEFEQQEVVLELDVNANGCQIDQTLLPAFNHNVLAVIASQTGQEKAYLCFLIRNILSGWKDELKERIPTFFSENERVRPNLEAKYQYGRLWGNRKYPDADWESFFSGVLDTDFVGGYDMEENAENLAYSNLVVKMSLGDALNLICDRENYCVRDLAHLRIPKDTVISLLSDGGYGNIASALYIPQELEVTCKNYRAIRDEWYWEGIAYIT